MDGIVGILLLFYLSYKNNTLAKQKGLNGIVWGILTAVCFIVFEAVGLFLVISMFCRDTVDMSILSRPHLDFNAASQQFNAQVAKAMLENPLREISVMLFSFGGYLLIRYILERKPDKKTPEVHWMDKMGEQ